MERVGRGHQSTSRIDALERDIGIYTWDCADATLGNVKSGSAHPGSGIMWMAMARMMVTMTKTKPTANTAVTLARRLIASQLTYKIHDSKGMM